MQINRGHIDKVYQELDAIIENVGQLARQCSHEERDDKLARELWFLCSQIEFIKFVTNYY